MNTPPAPSRRATASGLALLLGALTCTAGATALASRVAQLTTTAAARRPDSLVELAVLAVGVLVLGWLAWSSFLAIACLAARGAGRTWRRGEACVHRFAPALVRRALTVAVAVGLGASGVGVAVADDGTPQASPVASVSVSAPVAGSLDLGWVVDDDTTQAPDASTSNPATSPSGALPDAVPTASAGPPTVSAATPTSAPTPAPTAAPTAAPSRRAATGAGPSAPATPTTGAAALGPAATASGTSGSPASGGPTSGSPASGNPAPGNPAPSGRPTADGSTVAAPTGAPALASPGAAPGAGGSADGSTDTVTVLPGDTLWVIAARHLGPSASDAEIAAAWPAWYQANATEIGPDPDLIHPGQVLETPAEVAR